MSKSLNNFFLVKDVLAQYSADALRFFLLSTHYRSPLDFSDDRLEEAETNMERLRGVIERSRMLEKSGDEQVSEEAGVLRDSAEKAMALFHEAMDDDFNTGLASGALFDLAKALNTYDAYVQNGGRADKNSVEKAMKNLKIMTDILGILEHAWNTDDETNGEDFKRLMDGVLQIRQSAREKKQYEVADEIRDRLGEIGILIEDMPDGARWKKRGF